MTTYTTPAGDKVIVCDGCSISHDGIQYTKAGLARLTPVNHTAQLQAHLSLTIGAIDAAKAALKISDFCPDCRRSENV